MQPISSFNSNLGIAILLVGGAGSGKTALAGRLYPRTYFNVSDLNFKSGIDYLAKLGLSTNLVGFDTPSIDTNGKLVPAKDRYARMLAQLNEACKNPAIDCIVLDSATFIEDILKAKICGAPNDASIRLSGFEHWGNLQLLWKQLILDLRSSGKKFIMTAHEVKEKDESDQIFKYKISVDGKIASMFPALFSDVWRTEVSEANGKHTWNVRLLGNIRQEHLKNTFGFPGLLTQDELVTKINSTSK